LSSCGVPCTRRSFPTRRSSELRFGFGITIVAFLAAVGWLLIHLIPRVVTQLTQLAAQLPAALTYAGEWFEERTDATTSPELAAQDRKSTRLNSSHVKISYAVFC